MTKNEILIDLSESERTNFGKKAFEDQPVPQKVFSAVWALESEVNNGGFHQYFLNSSESVDFITSALESIGARDTARICAAAIAMAFPEGVPQPKEIVGVTENLSEQVIAKLETCDEEFFSYPNDLIELLFAYVSKYPQEFGSLPDPVDA